MLSDSDANELQARPHEMDPEEAWAGDELALEETDDDLDRPSKRPATKEKGLRLRGAIQLDEQEYAGKSSSRKAIFGDDDALHASATALGDASSSVDEGSQNDVESTDEDIRELRRKQKAAASAPDNGIDGAAALAFQEDPQGSKDDEEDEETAALEREVEATRAQDEAAITDRADRAAKERAKGAAVRSQKALWERSLEMRILLQRCLQAANRLPQPHMHAAACRVRPELRSGYSGLADASAATIDQLLDMHDALLERTPSAQLGNSDASNKGTGLKRKRGSHSDDTTAGQQWQRLDAAYQRFAPFRDSSMDRWHRKTLLMTGSGALRSNLKALNQSLSAQVAALAKGSGPVVMRMRLPAALSSPLMGRLPTEDETEEDDQLEAAGERRDAETFDDAEFYQQLLKEFLEGSAAGSGAGALVASAAIKKRRKSVERRASKGRKLRYQVMEKLVHFMTPVPRTETTLAPQLFSNLFGQPRNEDDMAQTM